VLVGTPWWKVAVKITKVEWEGRVWDAVVGSSQTGQLFRFDADHNVCPDLSARCLLVPSNDRPRPHGLEREVHIARSVGGAVYLNSVGPSSNRRPLCNGCAVTEAADNTQWKVHQTHFIAINQTPAAAHVVEIGCVRLVAETLCTQPQALRSSTP